MKILPLVPARGGSKGVKNKNIKGLSGKPLLSWTIQSVQASSLGDVYVSTDNSEIAAEARKMGAQVIDRPPHLASDEARSLDVILHALENTNRENFDAVMLLQPTSPFRAARDIDDAVQSYINAVPKADSLVSVTDIGGAHPARMRKIVNGLLQTPEYARGLEGVPRQELDKLYILNGAIYLTSVETLRSRSLTGSRSIPHIMPAARSINIDTEFDFYLAEQIAAKK